MDWAPFVASVIAIAGMAIMWVIGFLQGYNTAKDGK
jgi:hypothetical protein